MAWLSAATSRSTETSNISIIEGALPLLFPVAVVAGIVLLLAWIYVKFDERG